MTDDLVKRLRWLGDHASFDAHMHHTAADRIEKLTAALNKFLDDWDDGGPMCEPLRKALEGKDD